MTFKKTSSSTWEANKKDISYFIDLVYYFKSFKTYYLTITKGDEVIMNDIFFYKLNEVKQYAKQLKNI